MSRHAITPHEPEQYLCWVGYDRGADSYYIYVARHMETDRQRRIVGDNNGHCVYYYGTKPREIDTVERLAELLARYAVLPKNMLEVLRDDRVRESAPQETGVEPVNKGFELKGERRYAGSNKR